jgi:general secretion pathway protein E
MSVERAEALAEVEASLAAVEASARAGAEPAEAGPPPAEQPAGALPFSYANRHGVLLAGLEDGCARVLHRPGLDPDVVQEVRRVVGRPLALTEVSDEEFAERLGRAYERGSDQAREAMEVLGDDLDLSQVADALPEPEDLLDSEDDAPIIRLINALLSEAIKQNASDIHIEPMEGRLMVRFRVDGVLREVLEPRSVLAPLVASRIKVMARLDIAEKRLPQDGRISLRLAGRAVDVRVSSLPSAHGERIVLRLLDKQAGRLDLEHLGMGRETHDRVIELIHRPHGILLVTGPTGSGKTTTLYAALSRINDKQRNIMTVEDPIEYYLDNVGQTQVNAKVDMTFARGLRAILRQDPDVVMVGEIRDVETVRIAIQASLTGHLVLSTLHTNTAVGAITRLRDMGVEPFLLSSSLLGVLAQRLVRVLCPACKAPYPATPVECRRLGVPESPPPTLHGPRGCPACNRSGYQGRKGIYELVPVDEAMRTLIHDGASEHDLVAHARTLTPSIWDDGRRRVLAGDTSLEEVLRVTESG